MTLHLFPALAVCSVLTLCAASGSAWAHGFPDQVNDPITFSGFDCGSSPPRPARLYQSFTPTRPVLSGVELRVYVPSPPRTQPIRIQVQAGRPEGDLLVEAIQPYPAQGSPGPFSTALVHFDFRPPIHVNPGEEYFIAWMGPSVSFWVGTPSDVYPGGRGYSCSGSPWPTEIDLNFRTFAEPAAPSAVARTSKPQATDGFETTASTQAPATTSWGRLKAIYR